MWIPPNLQHTVVFANSEDQIVPNLPLRELRVDGALMNNTKDQLTFHMNKAISVRPRNYEIQLEWVTQSQLLERINEAEGTKGVG